MEPVSLAAMGGELRARRRARGLTRATLAEAVGARPVIIGRWERGEGIPTPEQARGLAEALELPPTVAADWESVAERAGLMLGGEAQPRPTWARARRDWWRPGRRGAGLPTSPADERARNALPAAAYHSYLDDPAEQRRYTLRWALTLVILAALAVCLVWALVELAQGWRALVELFRTGPPTGNPAGAFGLVGAV
jgi:transcriptional regulator with XRE-family HTH domain